MTTVKAIAKQMSRPFYGLSNRHEHCPALSVTVPLNQMPAPGPGEMR